MLHNGLHTIYIHAILAHSRRQFCVVCVYIVFIIFIGDFDFERNFLECHKHLENLLPNPVLNKANIKHQLGQTKV